MLTFMAGILYVLHILCCVILIVVVLMHESKGDSLASAFGGGGVDSAFGVQFGKKVSRFTVGAAVIFMALSIVLGIYDKRYSGASFMGSGGGSKKPIAIPAGQDPSIKTETTGTPKKTVTPKDTAAPRSTAGSRPAVAAFHLIYGVVGVE